MADTDTFEDLGLRTELVAAVAEAGYPHPSPLQSAALPVLRRGGNAVLRASAGSGIVAAYGLALLDRLTNREETEREPAGPGGLILVPAPSVAGRIAGSLVRFARAVDLRVLALAPGWPGIEQAGEIDVIVASPADALGAVKSARLKLGAVMTVVLNDADQQLQLGAVDALDTLVDSLPSEAQRVLASATFPDPVEKFIDARIRRPMHIPPRPATGEKRSAQKRGTEIGYAIAANRSRTDLLADWLDSPTATGGVMVYCRTEARAGRVSDLLSMRGFRAVQRTPDKPSVLAVNGAGADLEQAFAISLDVSFDAEALTDRHAEGGLVLIRPRELAHLRNLANDAGLDLAAVRLPADNGPSADVDAYRGRIRRAAGEEDLAAQLLILEPLLNEFTAAELAAAASALLRRRPIATEETPPSAPARPTTAPSPAPSAPPAWSRLFMSIGRRDDVRPGDIVGAITGETDVSGDQIGRIDIHDNFSIVEVANETAERIIAAMNGITMKRRALRVDYDRKPGRGSSGRGRRPSSSP